MILRIGYIITAHTLPDHLVRLVRRLRAGDTRFYIHLDARAPASLMDMVARELGGDDQVRLLPRHRCHWASFSLVEAALKGVRAVLEEPEPIDYAILLTGQDYPLRPPAAVEAVLAAADGRSFMSHWPSHGLFLDRIERWHWHGGLLRWRVKIPNRFLPFSIKRTLPGGLRPFTGSAHWCLSRACLEFVADYVDGNPDMVRFFRHTSVPDESFFQTVLMNSPLAPTIVNDDLRYIDWSEGRSSPRTLTMEDRDRVLDSGALFARKFDPRVDAQILAVIDASIERQAREIHPP